ncbi:hypothetical protein FQN53_008666 [Emmonsiellopsis sp. PD_33]|nr:hypothetical protein FQN53_008666 [Emmonsiellopsis sp. PD_33]
MASSTGSHLPPGISEPLAVDTSEDHSGFAAIITAAFLGFVLGTLGIRAYVQYSRHVVKKDDYVLLGATILLCIQSSLIFVQIARGWGTSMVLLPPPPHTELLKINRSLTRLRVILPAAFHLHYIKKLLDSADPTLIGSYVTICAQIELSYGIMANTIPCLKPFMAAYEDTGNKPSYRSRSPDGSPNNGSGAFKKDADSSNTSNTYVLSKISSNISSRFRNPWTSGALATHSRNNSISNPLAQHPQPPPRSKQPLRTDDVRYTATVGPGSWPDSQERQDQSLESHDSKRLVIKKDVKWNVECSRCGALDGFASSAPEVEGQSKTTTTPV